MSSLPRIDQVETAIKDQLEDGTILKQLTNELIEELEALDLIRPLLKARVKTIVLSYKVDDIDASENTTTQEIWTAARCFRKVDARHGTLMGSV